MSWNNNTTVLPRYELSQLIREWAVLMRRRSTEPDLVHAVYHASRDVDRDTMVIIDPAKLVSPEIYWSFGLYKDTRVRVIYHPLSDEPGAWSTPRREEE